MIAKNVAPTDEHYGGAHCPGCGLWKTLDADQWFARVSTHCKAIEDARADGMPIHTPGCGFHETVNWQERFDQQQSDRG